MRETADVQYSPFFAPHTWHRRLSFAASPSAVTDPPPFECEHRARSDCRVVAYLSVTGRAREVWHHTSDTQPRPGPSSDVLLSDGEFHVASAHSVEADTAGFPALLDFGRDPCTAVPDNAVSLGHRHFDDPLSWFQRLAWDWGHGFTL